MSIFSPINFVSGFDLVPIFAWITDKPADEGTDAKPAPVEGAGGATDGQPVDPTDVASAELANDAKSENDSGAKKRLVFLGFSWSQQVGFGNYPRPDWMAGIAGLADDPSDPSTKRDDRKHANDAARALQASTVARPASAVSPDDAVPKNPSGDSSEG